MIKIVFVLPNMSGGGTERVVAMLANEFVKRGFPVAVLLFAGNQTAYPLSEQVEICMAGEASGGKLSVRVKRLIKMRRFYKENRGCYIFAFSVMGAVFSVLAAAGISHRMLVSERNDPSRFRQERIRNWAYGYAEKLIAQTDDMKAYFPKRLQGKMTVIPNPVSDDMPEPFRGKRQKKIVSVARLQPQKNHRLLLSAFAEFVKEFPEYELHLFGVGDLEEELRRYAEELGVLDRVYFRGFERNVKEKIRDSAMFVLSSDYEGISNSMIEALAMGIPVISTDCPIGGSRAYIRDGVNGLLVPVGNKSALADAMRKIAGNSGLAENLSQNAVRVRETYSLSKIAGQFLEEAGIIQ